MSNMKMDQRVKGLWTKALNSGLYNQGKDQLRSDKGHCCLGVLCEVYTLDTGRGWWDNNRFSDGTGDSSFAALPDGVAEWAGMTSFDTGGSTALNPKLYREDLRTSFGHEGENFVTLAQLNDKGMPFEEIAKVIEEEF